MGKRNQNDIYNKEYFSHGFITNKLQECSGELYRQKTNVLTMYPKMILFF